MPTEDCLKIIENAEDFATSEVVVATDSMQQPITSGLTDQPITSGLTDQPITSPHTDQPITSAPTDQTITSTLGDQPITSALTDQPISGASSVYYCTQSGVQVISRSDAHSVSTLQSDVTQFDAKRIYFIKYFSILAILLFPPLGLPAYCVGLQTEELSSRTSATDMRKLLKKVQTCERLIMMSFILGVIMYTLLVTLVEKYYFLNGSRPARMLHFDSTHIGN